MPLEERSSRYDLSRWDDPPYRNAPYRDASHEESQAPREEAPPAQDGDRHGEDEDKALQGKDDDPYGEADSYDQPDIYKDDDRSGQGRANTHAKPRARQGHRAKSKRLSAPVILSAIIAIVLLASVGVIVRTHTGSSGKPQATPLNQLPTTSAQQTATGGPSAKATASNPAPSHSPTAAQQPPTSAVPPSDWKLAFDAGFSGTTLDTGVWATCYPWATGSAGCTNYGNNNAEKEWYLPSQVSVSGGTLNLTATREATAGTTQNGAPETYECRSGMVTTAPSFNFEYGMVQVVMHIPFNTGLWEGFWLAASNGAWPPEIDLMEHWNSDADGKYYLHPTSGARQGGPEAAPGVDLGSGFHTLTLSWTSSSLEWFLDGHEVLSTTTGVPHQAMYFIANLADTSTAAGACNGTVQIKSVKIWQPPS